MIAWNFQRIVGTCQFRVPWFGYPCGYSSLTKNQLIQQGRYTDCVDELIFKVINASRLPINVRCLLGEFANIGQIPQFEKLIATIRSREISASIILQSKVTAKGSV